MSATAIDKSTYNVYSETNMEIDRKIREGVKPSHSDKKLVQNRIKQLDKHQQLHLFHTIIKPLDIYSITDNGTFFDLNELSAESFWKLNYHVNLTYDCIQRDRLRSELEEKNASSNNLYNRDNDIESEPDNKSTHVVHCSEDNLTHTSAGASYPSSYSTLRETALKATGHKPSILNSEYESKVLERNIYTDKRKR